MYRDVLADCVVSLADETRQTEYWTAIKQPPTSARTLRHLKIFMILLLTRSPGYYDARVQPLSGREAASLIRFLLLYPFYITFLPTFSFSFFLFSYLFLFFFPLSFSLGPLSVEAICCIKSLDDVKERWLPLDDCKRNSNVSSTALLALWHAGNRNVSNKP